MVGGGKRPPPKPSSPSPHSSGKPKPSSSSSLFSISDLTPLLSLLASSISLSLRFLSSHDLLLLPSQTLALDSSLLSSALSLSRLLSLLPFPLQTLTLTTISLEPPFPSPSLPSSWFLRFLSSPSHSSSSLWLDSFRMSRSSFYHLLQALSPSLSASTSLALPPDHKLGAALFRLAHAASFRAVARRFGLPLPAVACRAFYEVVKAIADCLGELLELNSARVLDRFNSLDLFNCCGVIGFTNFPVKEGSVIAQGLVDAEGRFLNVSVGWHGEMTPAEILSKSKLSNAHSVVLGNGRYVLGGSCCPLLPWLLTPFKKEEASEDCYKNSIFNDVHARLMEASENAFARVRAQWRLLGTRWNGECDEALPYVIVASCLLHNYLIERGEPMQEEGDGSVKEQEFLDFEGDGDEEGKMIREVIASHLRMVSQR